MTNALRKSDHAIIKKLFGGAVVTMAIAELTSSISAVIDGILTGQFLGKISLAASGLGTPYFSVACLISMVIMMGCTSRCTNAIGRGDADDVKRAFSLSVTLALALGTVLSVCGFIFSKQFVILFGGGNASPELKEMTSGYLKGLFLGTPGFILCVLLTPLVQLDGNPHIAKVSSAVMILSDVAGDVLNALVFRGGMFGMGLATSVAQWLAAAVVLTHFFKKDRMLKFSFAAVRFSDAPRLLSDGLPMAFSMVGRALLPIILNNLIISRVGDYGSTAYSALISASFVLGALGWGIGGAVMMMGGMMHGEQDAGGLKTVIVQGLKIILLGVIPFGLVVFFTAPLAAKIFIPDGGEAYTYLADAFKFYAATLPFLAFNVLSSNYFQATGRKIESNVINFCIEVVMTATAAVIFIGTLGINGVWAAFLVGQSTLSLMILARCLIFRDKTRKGIYSIMALKKDFGIGDADLIECSVSTAEEVVTLSENIAGFCKAHNFSAKETYRLALCIEEMAGNVIEHGFNDGKDHHLDVRIIYKNGGVVLRMRDDCRKFDLREKAKTWAYDKDRPEANIGIRLVLGAAQKIDYTNAMNTNNLIVTIKRD